MVELVINADHAEAVLAEAFARCRHRLFIATADVKNVHLPSPQGAQSILDIFDELAGRGIQINLLHSGVPSGPFLGRLTEGVPQTLLMRRCIRTHAKAVIVDGGWMYLGSANLTGAGMGAKSPRRRNFEAGIYTDELPLIDPIADMLEGVFSGAECEGCGRTDHCPEPLESPAL